MPTSDIPQRFIDAAQEQYVAIIRGLPESGEAGIINAIARALAEAENAGIERAAIRLAELHEEDYDPESDWVADIRALKTPLEEKEK